jgi:hypothetical protein
MAERNPESRGVWKEVFGLYVLANVESSTNKNLFGNRMKGGNK